MRHGEVQGENDGMFLFELFELTEEQSQAVRGWIPMTQEIYGSIIDRCMEIGESADPLFFRMLEEFPEEAAFYADGIEKEVEEAGNCDIPDGELERAASHTYAWIMEKAGKEKQGKYPVNNEENDILRRDRHGKEREI